MSTPCPICSAAALGNDAASLCTECATATVAGTSFSLPGAIAAVALMAATYFAFKAARKALHRPSPTAPTLAHTPA